MKVRRLLTTVVAFVLLALFLPVIITVTLVILITSPGPIFFRQVRVGYKGRLFKIYKFRTFKLADNAPSVEQDKTRLISGRLTKPAIDKIYPFGDFLRKTSLDELPQLFNILLGNMVFIGPRPHVQWELDELYPNGYVKILDSTPPGITGLNQVRRRHHASPRMESRYDTFWAKHKSLRLNSSILLLTVVRIFISTG